MLPLEYLWRADRLQATHVKHVLSAPQEQSRHHQMHVGRDALGLQLPGLVAEAGLIPLAHELFTVLFDEGDFGRIARAVWPLELEEGALSDVHVAVQVVRRLARYGLYAQDLRHKRMAWILDNLAGPTSKLPRSFRSCAQRVEFLEVGSPTMLRAYWHAPMIRGTVQLARTPRHALSKLEGAMRGQSYARGFSYCRQMRNQPF